MQIIFLLLLSSTLFAQKHNPLNQCDPVEAEKECYSLLCTNTPKTLIPGDPAELTAAYQAHPYELHPDIVKDLDKIGIISDLVKEAGKKSLAENETEKMAAELVATPVETAYLLNDLYKGELSCLQQNGKCTVISSDLKKQSEEMKAFFKKLNDSTHFFRESIVMKKDERKDSLNEMLSQMSGKLSADEMKAEKKNIKKLKSDVDFMIYMMDAKWLNAYKAKVAEDLKPFLPAVAVSLRGKINDLLEIDLSSDKAKLKVKNSCQLASYIKTTIDREITFEKFDEKKLHIINSFKSKFLPKLSESSAKELSARLKPEEFFLIPENVNFHPFAPALGQHSKGYEEPKNQYQVLRDLSILPRLQDFRCQSKGMLIKDNFNFGTGDINISRYALANNFNDAITHEVGHWLSAQMKHKNMSGHSRRKLLDVRECVRGFYPADKEKSAFLLKHSGDKSRTEEDFADWFAATSGLGESGLFCDLKKMVNNFVGGSNESSYLPHKGDPHSNLLFREITLRLNRGETLPQSCKDLNDYYPEAKSQKCEW